MSTLDATINRGVSFSEYPFQFQDGSLQDENGHEKVKSSYQEELILIFFNSMLESFVQSYECYCSVKKIPRVQKYSDMSIEEKDFKDVRAEDLERNEILSISGTKLILKEKNCATGDSLPKFSFETIIGEYDVVKTPSELLRERAAEMIRCGSKWVVPCHEEVARIVYKNGNIYEGEVLKKVPHGYGRFYWSDGTIYKGEFEDGHPTGNGKMMLPDLCVYTGAVYKGYFHGQGVYNIPSTNIIYSGGWRYGKKDGKGWLLYGPNSWYEGDFKNDKRHGYGVHKYSNGGIYEGEWFENKKHGRGAMRWPNNDIYVGEWKDGVINGYGEYTWKAGLNLSLSFPVQNTFWGSWVNGMRTGVGIMHFGLENGAKMVGTWENNFKHGAAIVICGNGKIIQNNPLFQYDKPIHLPIQELSTVEEPNVERKDQEGSENTGFNGSSYQKIVSQIMDSWTSQTDEILKNVVSKKSVFKSSTKSFINETDIMCNPMEVQLQSRPDDVDLSFYINIVLKKYATLYDTLQFDIIASSDSSFVTNTTKMHSSKWNMLTLTSKSHSKQIHCQDQLGPPRRNSIYTNSQRHHHIKLIEEKFLRNLIIRCLPKLTEVYYHYACICSPVKCYYKHYLIRMFLWQLYIDIGILKEGVSLVDTDLFLANNSQSAVDSNHNPFEYIYFYQFLQSLMGAAWLIHVRSNDKLSGEGVAAHIFEKFLNYYLFPNAGKHKGRALFEFKDLLPLNAVYKLYKKLGEPHSAKVFLANTCVKKGHEPPCYKRLFGRSEQEYKYIRNFAPIGREVLYYSEDPELGQKPKILPRRREDLFYGDLAVFRGLGVKIILQCLATICPPVAVKGDIVNIDHPLTFLEFYETIILCSLLLNCKDVVRLQIAKSREAEHQTKSESWFGKKRKKNKKK